jgi:hypothetical protein
MMVALRDATWGVPHSDFFSTETEVRGSGMDLGRILNPGRDVLHAQRFGVFFGDSVLRRS